MVSVSSMRIPSVSRSVASDGLLARLVLEAEHFGVRPIGELGEQEQVVPAEGLALLPVALLRHLAMDVGLVGRAIEPVEGDVVGQITAREAVGPDAGPKVAHADDLDWSLLFFSLLRRGVLSSCATRYCHD